MTRPAARASRSATPGGRRPWALDGHRARCRQRRPVGGALLRESSPRTPRVVAVALVLVACGDAAPSPSGWESASTSTVDTGSSGSPTSTSGEATTQVSTSGTTVTTGTSTVTGPGSVDEGSTRGTTAPVCDSSPETGGKPGTTGGGAFVFFDRVPACDFVQVDRVGKPLVGRVLVVDGDAYNQGNPLADTLFTFENAIFAAIVDLHEALDAALIGEGYTPCENGCTVQVTPFLYPDTLLLDRGAPSSFPNGRRLDDPAADRFLGRILLDIPGSHTEDGFADVPLNPPTNDVDFPSGWPYLAPPHP